MARIISRTVWVLSMVSLFTDMASEMLYPIMPIYLKQIGFSIVGIGILEGFAECIAGLGKGYFGKWSDAAGRRLPFVQLGYGLSAISKPMMALLVAPAYIFGARAIDRIGKGIRTGARDALLSQEATPATKATVFGFHRSMDTLGATLGPALALLYLNYYPGQYRWLFLAAFIPGLLAIACTFFIKDKPFVPTASFNAGNLFAFTRYWRQSPMMYRQLVGALLAFALINSSDVFLLLKMKEAGISDFALILVYIFYNLVFAALAYPLGKLADRFGFKRMLLAGLLLFSGSYLLMGFTHHIAGFVAVFFLYGIYAAATEGISKAWVSNMVPQQQTATAIGTFTGFQSIAALLASAFAGWLWYTAGSMFVFLTAAAVSGAVFIYIYTSINYAPHAKP